MGETLDIGLFGTERSKFWSFVISSGMYADPVRRLRLLESVAVHANDAILITDAEPIDGVGPRIVYANAAFERMTGYAEAEVLGKTPRILQGPATSVQTRARIRHALQSWANVRVELLNYHKDGSTFWVELSIVPVADEAGWFTHWISVQRDVSPRRAAEALASHTEIVEAQNAHLSREVGSRIEAEAKLAHVAFHDELTGLYNRSHFTKSLRTSLARAKAGDGRGFAVIYFDLDRFKLVNDSLGHDLGDTLLQRVAERVATCVEPSDVLARMGGDEFAILLEPLVGTRRPAELAENIVTALAVPFAIGDVSIVMNASVGIVLGDPDDVAPEDVLRDADTAMYHAKRAGGEGYAVFDEAMHREALASFELVGDLRRAIERDEFVVHYQPIVELATGRVEGFEALVRWMHPQRGLISPLDFIGVAEETGAIVPIGRIVLRKVCAALARWRALEPAFETLFISVNVSSVQLRDASFVETLTRAIDDFGLPASALQLEVTESILLDDIKRTSAMLERIRSIGTTIAIDDFGTGYSSLSYLERFPLDVLKIDRSFVSRMADGKRNVEIIRSIAGLGRVLELEVLAEGIESEAERVQLQAMGFTSGQGYLFARPMSERDVQPWLARNDRPAERTLDLIS